METVLNTSLPADPSAIREARHSIAHLTPVFPDGFVSAVQLAISELVTNSILYGSVPGGQVELCIRHKNGSHLRIEVYDSGLGFTRAEPAAPADDSTHGRGLMIVEMLADDWGVDRDGGRHCVWAEFSPAGAFL